MPAAEIATRFAYAEELARLGNELPHLVVLDADVGKSFNTSFAQEHPQRCFNFGIAEQNAVSAAAGLATTGLLPFVNTFAIFASLRAMDQIRTTVCYPSLNVKIAGSHAGLTTATNGATHQAMEDIALMRALPNMTVIMPADAASTRLALRAAAQWDGPVYLRLTRVPVPAIYDDRLDFQIGRAITVQAGQDVTLMAIGDMLPKALQAAAQLAGQGISARVVDMHTIKPIDESAILAAARQTGGIVTVEDHTIVGGLGSAVAEVLAEKHPARLRRIGTRDRFTESGDYEALLSKYGLSVEHIVAAAREVLAR
jgi:transketolase